MRKTPTDTPMKISGRGFVLPFTILLILGVTAIAVGTIFNSHTGMLTGQNYKNKIRTFSAADGMMTLLTQEILNGRGNVYADTTNYGKIKEEVFTGAGTGTDATVWKSSMTGTNDPLDDSSTYLGTSRALRNRALNDYGVRYKAWLMPPLTGSYRFMLRAQGGAAFYLSTDNTVANLSGTPACKLTASTATTWPAPSAGVNTGLSNSVSLQAGKRYYFEFYFKSASAGDIGEVAWEGPEWYVERPALGPHLSAHASVGSSSAYDVGGVPVQYLVAGTGMDEYLIRADASLQKAGNSSDTVCRIPLNQRISTKGTMNAPPATIKKPVIYYDFHADTSRHSNPEFEEEFLNGGWTTPNLVKRNQLRYVTQDADYFGMAYIAKPIRDSSTSAAFTCKIDKWFRPWAAGDFNVPSYGRSTLISSTTFTSKNNCEDDFDDDGFNMGTTWSSSPKHTVAVRECRGSGSSWKQVTYSANRTICTDSTVTYDTAFKNTVIKDSLTFTRRADLGTNYYEIVDTCKVNTSTWNCYTTEPGTGFFPLDGQGFGQDHQPQTTHNYSFCMEMHTEFKHEGGLTFQFYGDDDVWVFINDTLMMDLGFVHNALSGTVSLDQVANLEYGKTYGFDFFFCERKATGSTIKIVSNLPMERPQGKLVAQWRRDYGSMD